MEVEKLYSTLNRILDTHEILEIGLLPYQSIQTNNEYYPFLLIESNLGIPLKYVDKIYKYAHGIFMNVRGDGKVKPSETVKLLKDSTRCMVIINADCYSALNTRKKLIIDNHIDPTRELKFIDLLFTFPKHTKHSTIWFHRKWIILRIQQHFSSNDISQWQYEINITRRVAELYPKNYYAWTYRHWILLNIKTDSVQSKSFFVDELKIMKIWVQTNISDYSGFQHLQRCLIRIGQYYDNSFSDFYGISRRDILNKININTQLQNRDLKKNSRSDSIVSLWYKEIQFTKDLILRYPGHESLWYHLRFLSFGWIWLKLSGYLNNSIEYSFNEIDENNNSINSITKKWPELENELEFSRYCINLVNQERSERMVIQKQNALAFELWISELNDRRKKDIKDLISKLADISIDSNYYIVQNKKYSS
ncbi:unnamed protein product [Rhizophagus irregularis]|uniref:Death domain-containing protein n=2 Tax=Rhizophagus irregularis TaxID=588596 RepID=A0A916EH11_9GLOM|nr:unnamed protein product [Rhizophagus irregularis]GET52092.1 protein prenyltransferase alpha subunit repeat-containing protein 1 [Rhizophagus irregularis DAOM 181602=DAOM 197198]CAB4417503.1 unnamed protein product [Rhizophagus irregularis]CAB4492254.1 unnamed protein product [Rhizophagus irregularis]CAB5358604.1 unnamed protein product [Rhizophagus irregularis]